MPITKKAAICDLVNERLQSWMPIMDKNTEWNAANKDLKEIVETVRETCGYAPQTSPNKIFTTLKSVYSAVVDGRPVFNSRSKPKRKRGLVPEGFFNPDDHSSFPFTAASGKF